MDSPSCVSDFEELAKAKLDDNTWGYYSYGANQKQTLKENEDAFYRYYLRPRLLRDVSCVDTRTKILGQDVDFPVGIAPTGLQKMAHQDGEKATAKASSNNRSLMILSAMSNTSLEEVAEASGSSGLRWMQTVLFRDKSFVKGLMCRAEKAGYRAIVVTLDQPTMGIRLQGRFTRPSHLSFPNLGQYSLLTTAKDFVDLLDPTCTWSEIDWMKSQTNLPIIVKGILTGEDAIEAVQHGVSGIIVSNHGGRQLDGVPATIDVLSEVVAAVEGRVEVYLDGGVRQGTDVLKSLALGARAVFIGRPVIWGLTHNGQDGVERVFEILKNEFKTAMMLSGCRSIADINQDLIRKN